jgi:hypothetical protein
MLPERTFVKKVRSLCQAHSPLNRSWLIKGSSSKKQWMIDDSDSNWNTKPVPPFLPKDILGQVGQ